MPAFSAHSSTRLGLGLVIGALLGVASVGCASPATSEASSAASEDALISCIAPAGTTESPCAAEEIDTASYVKMFATAEGLYGLSDSEGGSTFTLRVTPRDATTAISLPTTLSRANTLFAMTASEGIVYALVLAPYDAARRASYYVVYSIDAATGATTKIAAVEHPGWAATDEQGSIQVSNGTLYWSQCGGAQSAPRGSIQTLDLTQAGATPSALSSRLACPRSISVDDTHVYAFTKDAVVRVAKEGSAPEVVAERRVSPGSATHLVAVTVSDGFVYWADAAFLWRAPTSDLTDVVMLGNPVASSFAVVDGAVFTTGSGSVSRYVEGGAFHGERFLESGAQRGIVASGTDLYWSGARTFRLSLAPAAAAH